MVDGVNTLEPGEAASVEVGFDGSNVHFTFGIPRGADGHDGNDGGQGSPGEVSQGQLDGAIGGTANNPGGIAPFTGTFSDPPTQAEMQNFAAWSETLRAALVR